MKVQIRRGCARCLAFCLAGLLLSGCAPSPTPMDNSADNEVSIATSTESSGTSPTESASSLADTTDRSTTTAKAPISTTTAKTTAATTTAQAASVEATTQATRPRPTLPQPQGTGSLDSRTYKSKTRIGDWGGPAYAVYSNKGYNRASIDVELSQVEINMTRRSDKKTLVGYIFLGMNIYHPTDGYWVNCLDAGIGYDGATGEWTIFHFIYDVSVSGQNKWYKSHRALDPTHDYRLILDCSKSNGWVTLTAYDITDDRTADSIEFQARYALKDGSNVDFLQDYAIDMKDDLLRDAQGNVYNTPETAEDISDAGWKGIILYSTNENVYLRNIKITNATLNDQPWTSGKTRLRGCSPDYQQADIGYDVVKVTQANFDTCCRIDMDLNYG